MMNKKKIVEKKTGEKYTSKAAMAKHEKKEGKAEQMKEYGKVKSSPMKQTSTTKTAPAKVKMVKPTSSPTMMKKSKKC